MKRFLLVSLLFMAGCESSPATPSEKLQHIPPTMSNGGYPIKTINYDGCQYVIVSVYNGYSITHKGNCTNHSQFSGKVEKP